jgi:hypothetical protein
VRLLAIAMMLAVAVTGQGCSRTVPILTVVAAPLGPPPGERPTSEEVARAIWAAGKRLGWVIQEVRPGELTGSLSLRNHVAVVTIVHDTSTFSIKYKDSRNLLHHDDEIHRQYNNWVDNLAKAIQAETGSKRPR